MLNFHCSHFQTWCKRATLRAEEKGKHVICRPTRSVLGKAVSSVLSTARGIYHISYFCFYSVRGQNYPICNLYHIISFVTENVDVRSPCVGFLRACNLSERLHHLLAYFIASNLKSSCLRFRIPFISHLIHILSQSPY